MKELISVPNASEVAVNTTISASNTSITPTRKLTVKERKVFDRVLAEFIHLAPSDAEQLSQYAEAVIRYEKATKESKRHPTVSIPVVNRATGNIVGDKVVRNPAFATIKEAQSQVTALARRLMIDAHSSEKRQRLLTKKARALAASEAKSASNASALNSVTEGQIQAEMVEVANLYTNATVEVLRQEALWRLTVCYPVLNEPSEDFPELHAN